MDRVIPKKKWNSKRLATIGGAAAILALIGASVYFTSGKTKVNVDTGKITVSEIKKGPFQESIPVNGIVMPITTIYLDAMEGGRVEEKFVEDGAFMKKGDPIMRLSNTDLELSLVNQETQVFNLLTQMQISKNAARQNTIGKLNQMAEVASSFTEAERVYNLNKDLYQKKAVGLQEFRKSQLEYEYQVKRKKLTEQVLRQDSVSTREEQDQATQGYQRTQAALALMRKKVGDLVVRAPVDGQLTSMDAEIGQNRSPGQRLGQIDVLSGFKVRVDVDEHYITRIFTGLKGDFTLGDKTYNLVIRKVYTQVTNGRFQVDMAFAEGTPKDIRRGQTLQIRLALSDETQAILVPKGGFYQQTGGNWIFKVSENGKTAYKVDIQLGRQDPDYYEVLEGLKPGDKVVTSSYENFGDIQELVLKKE
ncbi:efflux RND transporter periplasmic adaptor subunit [Hufsiella ginkgonis]|uniref:Efflux RND transporter periplasmic adaptor subunit n=1 Tax=Hufsiella ginkgonis TaxID=2695274 RepID=A0A7K1XVL3_9SPHI|nr:efflux RND transporter periplasmic adaptor subunit [Hufsiella ginkgonis]MXV14848.1 efflux RND transporter periplasmic adaptor subunit [Hufsiella ginkgonis]